MLKKPRLEHPALESNVPAEAKVRQSPASRLRENPSRRNRKELGCLLGRQQYFVLRCFCFTVDHKVNTSRRRGPLGQHFQLPLSTRKGVVDPVPKAGVAPDSGDDFSFARFREIVGRQIQRRGHPLHQVGAGRLAPRLPKHPG